MVIAVGACSKNSTDAPPPTIAPASAAVSPPVETPVDGVVRPLGGPGLTCVFDDATATLVVLSGLSSGASTITTFPASGAPRSVALPSRATALTDDGHGTAYLAAPGGYLRFDVARGVVERHDVPGQQGTDFTAITRRADGRLALGSADGAVYTLGPDGTVGAQLKIFARVDELVAQGDTVVVLDRSQTSVTTVEPSGTKAQHALRAGAGATNMALDPAGRVLVTDTRGEQLLVFGSDPLMLRQQYPVRGAPYGVAGSARLAWVSETATNSVVGYDLATGIPVEKVRYRTVQQPNSLAFDDETGTLYVVSGSGAGVQVIAGAGRLP
jgi:DNA-binding beta-propeller fold protein YncE